jgi:hypothetical protein
MGGLPTAAMPEPQSARAEHPELPERQNYHETTLQNTLKERLDDRG